MCLHDNTLFTTWLYMIYWYLGSVVTDDHYWDCVIQEYQCPIIWFFGIYVIFHIFLKHGPWEILNLLMRSVSAKRPTWEILRTIYSFTIIRRLRNSTTVVVHNKECHYPSAASIRRAISSHNPGFLIPLAIKHLTG